MPQKSKHTKTAGVSSKARNAPKSKRGKECPSVIQIDDVAEGSREQVDKSLEHQG